MTSNLKIVSNLWINADSPDDTTAWSAADHMPGELRVNLIGSRDSRILRDKLTRKQYREYRERRFFFNHGETGIAFEDI